MNLFTFANILCPDPEMVSAGESMPSIYHPVVKPLLYFQIKQQQLRSSVVNLFLNSHNTSYLRHLAFVGTYNIAKKHFSIQFFVLFSQDFVKFMLKSRESPHEKMMQYTIM